MTDTQDLIREIQEHTAAHGGENTATHLLVQAAMALQRQADELGAIGAGGVSGPLMGRNPEGITRDDTVHGESYFTAADMAMAAAQGFRDGAASVAANAGSEPVARVNDDGFIVEIGDLLIAPGQKLYTHPSPLEGMVGGWIASKDQMPPPGVRVFWGDVDSHRVGYDSWAGDDYRWAPSHWMHIPEFPTPPTSSADSGKGE